MGGEQWLAFVQVFGGDCAGKTYDYSDAAAAKVLLDFVKQFPAGKAEKGTRKRGALDLTSYLRIETTKQAEAEDDQDVWMDFELFANALQDRRKWSMEKVRCSVS